ncbi:MAG TPA: hypothetical protein PKM78_12160 [Anaerolineae bacterium]|nr:hypothetical protein [Anaerolineae bacterium]HNU03208.1 hypothetical protein [Anaerolineae bacterium]
MTLDDLDIVFADLNVSLTAHELNAAQGNQVSFGVSASSDVVEDSMNVIFHAAVFER